MTAGAFGSSGEGSDPPVLHSVYEVAAYDGGSMVTKQPTPEERDEFVKVPLDPAEFIAGVLAVEPDAEDDDE